jgi:hypothetical protein
MMTWCYRCDVHDWLYGAPGESMLGVSDGAGNGDNFWCRILLGGVVKVALYHPVML